jgi:hypothetical protein
VLGAVDIVSRRTRDAGIGRGWTSATFNVTTKPALWKTSVTVTASYAGVKKRAVLTLTGR